MTGAGKTSILELLQRIDPQYGFNQRDLSEGSNALEEFTNNKIQAGEIPQLEAKFEINETDKLALPLEYENAMIISIKRFFDGGWEIDKISTGTDKNQINIQEELDSINATLGNLEENIEQAKSRIPDLAQYIESWNDCKRVFIDNIEDASQDSISILQNFKNNLFAIPHDESLQNIFNHSVSEIEANVNAIIMKKDQNPDNIVYEQLIPKPEYIAQLDYPIDSIPLDEYLNNEDVHESFNAIGRICSFNKNGLNSIRNDETARRQNFFAKASDTLTKEFRKFWKQTEYDLIISLDGQSLTFGVKDAITNKTTGVTQRSEGLQWVLSLFFKIKLLASSKGLSHILLLDSPATAVHDAGKEEIRKFMNEMAEKGNLQIIYTTHEKALIDPWRLNRIRFVKKIADEGTVIQNIKPNGIDSTRIEISKYIGSPAKYSLFGAPITVLFEGPSDYRFIAALNEYAIKNGRKHLHPDVYAIDDMGGIDNSPNITKIFKSLGLQYICVVDGGCKAKKLQKDMGDDEFSKNFVQITDVVSKQVADIEDLIDPDLYNHLFTKAYPDIDVTKYDNSKLESQKTVRHYTDILKETSTQVTLNKTGIATLLMDTITETPPELEEPLLKTVKLYEKLVCIIEEKTKIS